MILDFSFRKKRCLKSHKNLILARKQFQTNQLSPLSPKEDKYKTAGG
jgi:hypothetical protein